MPETEYHYSPASGLELVLTGAAKRDYPWHTHVSHHVSGLVLCGCAMLRTANTTLTLRRGECFNLPPLTAHSLATAPGTALAVLCRPVQAEVAANTPVRAVMGLLAERPQEVFSLDQMAALAGYSPWHFLRLFRKEAGMTPHAFQLVCRLRRARILLRGGMAAAQAAAAAGFADQSHMHRVLKRHHGLTPGKFLRSGFLMPGR